MPLAHTRKVTGESNSVALNTYLTLPNPERQLFVLECHLSTEPLDLSRSLSPFGVEGAFLIDPLIGVRTKVVALGLSQVLR